MNKILAIAGLTWKSAFRYRLFWIMAALLLGAVVGLPLLLKDDGSAKGLTQILVTYTLTAVATLLGICTLWLSCGTLARDVEECQMQVVVVKPIARWQIWIGKWLGLISLNAVLLALAGAAIFALLLWRASHLPADEQKILHDEIFVARASVRNHKRDHSKEIEAAMRQRVKNPASYSPSDLAELRQQIAQEFTSALTEVPPGFRRRWGFDLHTLRDQVRDKPLILRVKFNAANPNPDARYLTGWIVGPTNSPSQVGIEETLPPDSFQEIQVPANLLDESGILWVDVLNPTETSISFPLDDGLELLYPENGFGINFIRGILVILFWLILLAAVGLAMASFLSFPVAAFASMAVLLLGLSSGTLSTVVEQGTITGFDSAKSAYGHSPVDVVMVPVFHGALKIVSLVEGFSPVDSLSTGRSITWGQLGMAALQIVLLLGGFFCVMGILFFSRRELATAQGNN
jgi:hypothetical protein